MFGQRIRGLFTMTKKSPCSIQALYDLCKLTFTPSATSPPSSQAIHKLYSLLDTIGPKDVGLKDESLEDDRGHGLFGFSALNRVDRWAQPITYVDIHEGQHFTMCMFCFPTSAVIPLHDHPGMTVLSKVLYGSLHVKAYDWVEPACIRKSEHVGHPTDPLIAEGSAIWWRAFKIQHATWSRACIFGELGLSAVWSSLRLARLAVDKVVTAPHGTSVLYPKSGGNLHCFTAITPCAVLDILAPPYLEAAGRRCTYYRDYPYSSFAHGDEIVGNGEEQDYAWLAVVDTPEDLYMRPGRYMGPAVQR
ncbi:plant cysteine oxidase 3 isoform X1 [Capsicum galapagoense]